MVDVDADAEDEDAGESQVLDFLGVYTARFCEQHGEQNHAAHHEHHMLGGKADGQQMRRVLIGRVHQRTGLGFGGFGHVNGFGGARAMPLAG